MVVIRARMGDASAPGRQSMSIVLDNGDIHHFFWLNDGVHHSSTRQYRGRYQAAVKRELARPGAAIVDGEGAGAFRGEWPSAGPSSVYDPGALAS